MYYFTYMLRCKDNSIYTGYTNDLKKRMKAHFEKTNVGAKYTKSHDALRLEKVWRSKEKRLACQLEYYIKTLSKHQKENLIAGTKLKEYFSSKLDCRKFYCIRL